MPTRKFTRRRFLVTTAASTTLVAMPYVRGSYNSCETVNYQGNFSLSCLLVNKM
jgi:hypothetical protein